MNGINKIAFKNSLAFKLLLWFLSISLIPIIVLSYSGYKSSSQELKDNAEKVLKYTSVNHKQFVDNWFYYRKKDISSWSQNREFANILIDLTNKHTDTGMDNEEFVKSSEYMETIKGRTENISNIAVNYDYIYDLFLIDMNGNILYTIAKEDDLGTSLLDGPYSGSNFSKVYKKTLLDGGTYFSDLEKYSPSHGEVSSFITAPVTSSDGKMIGVFAIQISVDRVDRIFKNKKNSSYFHYLVGQDGALRSSIDEKKPLDSRVDSEIYKLFTQNKEMQILQYTNIFGEKSIGVYQNIDIMGVKWTLVSDISEDDLYLSIKKHVKDEMVFLLFIIIVVIAISIIASRKLFQPIELLTQASRDISLGNRDVKVSVDKSDEIGILANNFNKMVESLVNNEMELKKQKDEAQNALLELDKQKFALDEHSIVAITDIHGMITSVNDKFVDISGYSREELLGKNHRILNSGFHSKEFWVNMYKTVSSGKTWNSEICNISKSGGIYWVNTTIVPFMGLDGKVKSYIAIRTDITEQKEIEEELIQANLLAEKTLQIKSEFLASMSHEIRTPMNGVIGMLNLLLKTELTENQKHQAYLAKDSASALLVLINDILDFSKVDAGKMDLEYIDFNIRDEIGDLSESMSLIAEEKGVEIIVDVTDIDYNIINADPGRIRQILSNIVGNSVKFTKHGNIKIKAGLNTNDSENIRLVISISDTGIGIAEDKISSLFDSFSQVDASTTRKYGGTGLGLAIVKKLCELMDGTVSVSSVIGEGSTFTVDVSVILPINSPMVTPPVVVKDKKILIIDDNKSTIEALNRQLEHWDMKVYAASYAEEVFDTLSHNSIDIIFLDMYIPDIWIEELIDKIRSNPDYDSVKLIIMASLMNMGDESYFKKLNINGSFAKPATTKDLFAALSILDENFEGVINSTDSRVSQSDNEIKFDKSINILLVEDNATNQIVANGILSGFSLESDVANNGLEALEILNNSDKKYDLILMDCQMPEMDGYEATRAIRDSKAGEYYKDIPIIAMTANAMHGDREKCEIAGMDDYVAKPINPDILKATLLKWLSNEYMESLNDNDTQESTLETKSEVDSKEGLTVWDKEGALYRLGGSEKLLVKIIEVFLGDVILQKQELKSALDMDDKNKIKLHAHSIKGSAGNISALKLYELAKSMELDSDSSEIELLRFKYDEISQGVDEIVSLLNVYLKDFSLSSSSEKNITKEELIASLKSLHVELESGAFVDSSEVDIFEVYFDEDVNKMIKKLKVKVDNFITDQALKTIDDIILKLGDVDDK